jgi:flavodoxin
MGRIIKLFVFILLLCVLFFGVILPKASAQNNIKTLVVFFSRDGHTRKAAQFLVKKFGADIEELIDQKKRTGPLSIIVDGKDASAHALTTINPLKNNPLDYDIILVGTPSWFSNVTPAARTFVANYKLSDKIVGVFGTAHLTGVENALKQLSELISQGQNREIPALPLRHKDLEDKVLSKKIDDFYARIMKQVGVK